MADADQAGGTQRLNRRRALVGLAGCACCPATALAARKPALPPAAGCTLRSAAAEKELMASLDHSLFDPARMIYTSGDNRLDRALGLMLADLATAFRVRPGFAFYDDGESPNAVALSRSQLTNTRGTVAFGRNLFRQSMQDQNGDMFVMGVCAHEFGHILQFQTQYHWRLMEDRPTVKAIELHADYLSGAYVALHGNRYTARQLISLGQGWSRLGSSDYTDPDHHGTSEERLAAIEAGYFFVKRNSKAAIAEIAEAGAKYVEARA